MNLVDFTVLLGLPVAVLIAYILGSQVKSVVGKDYESISPYFWSVLIVLVLLDVSGKNLAETGRLWLFFMPLMPIIAAASLKGDKGLSAKCLCGLVVLQLAYAVFVRIIFDIKEVSSYIEQGIEMVFK
jgi:hypothetical protein